MRAPGRPPGRGQLPDEAARVRATTDLDTSLLVEAPAGSGKTTLLVARILAWLMSGRARLSQIVAITFTEKAAAELRLRVRESVEAARRAAPPAERPVLDQALADLDLAPIRTIHGFCGDLLRQRPVEAGVDPGFAIADALGAGLAFEETWERWLEEAVAGAPPALAEAVALGVSVETLRALARAMLEDRELLDGLPGPRLEDTAALNREVRARLPALLASAPPSARAERDRLVQHLGELAAWVRQTDPLPDAEQVTAVLTELPFRKVAHLGTQTAWGRERIADVRRELAELTDRVAAARTIRLHNLAATLGGWLRGFTAVYEERLRRGGALDFHGLLARARDLVRDRPDVRRDFQQRYRTILVDEFQDTDPLQVEIAFFLAEDPASPPAATWEAVRLAPGRLFVVGDPKQSIYRFRRADIETYERARERIAAQGDVLMLTTNFRSVGRLLDAVNRTFADQMQPPDDGRYQPAYAPVARAPDTPEGEGPLLLEWPADAPPSPAAGADDRRAREAAALARLVARAVAEAAWPVRERQGGTTRPATFGDVVCLFRTYVGVATYEEAFRAAGVPFRTLGGRQYYERSEVGWALAALAAIEDPYDPVALVAALRSPFFGVPDGALLAHAAAGGRFSYLAPLPAEADPGLAEGWRLLRELHGRRTRESPAAVVEALYAETEVLATYALDPFGDQRVANLLRIIDTARGLEAAGRPTFRALTRWLGAQTTGGYEESESPVAEEGDQVVRFMTVHAAKGLEFPVVIVPDLDWDRAPRTPPLLVDRRAEGATLGVSLGKAGEFRVETENLAAFQEREARRAEAEALRLFYVATTRARDHLVLPLLFAEPRGFAGFCAPLCDPAWDGARRVALQAADVAAAAGGDAPEAVGQAADALVPRAVWAAARARVLARGATAATVVHPGSRPAAAADGAGRRLGALVHLALALAELQASEGAAAAVEAAAGRLGERGERVALARRLVARALASPPYRRAATAARAYREVPVAAVVDGQLVEGVVDLVFEEAAGPVAVEVKLAPADAAARGQLGAYCRALAAGGLPVAEAWLLVLAPDRAEPIPVPVR